MTNECACCRQELGASLAEVEEHVQWCEAQDLLDSRLPHPPHEHAWVTVRRFRLVCLHEDACYEQPQDAE